MSLRDFRKKNHLSQEKLAKYLGVGQSFISQVETGLSTLSPDNIDKIISNDQGWDTTALQGPSVSVSASASGPHSKATASAGDILMNVDAAELARLRKENKELKEQVKSLEEEKKSLYKIIEKLTK